MRYVDRENGKISTVYSRPQYEGQEEIDEKHPEVMEFQKPPVFTPKERVENIFGDHSETMAVVFKGLLHLKNEIQDLKAEPHITKAQFMNWFEGQL
jgi:hypothetical protein